MSSHKQSRLSDVSSASSKTVYKPSPPMFGSMIEVSSNRDFPDYIAMQYMMEDIT